MKKAMIGLLSATFTLCALVHIQSVQAQGVSDMGKYYPETSNILHFQGRDIDVAPFYDAFPFNSYSFILSHDGSKLFFQRLGTGKNSRYQYIEADGMRSPLEGREAIKLDPTKCNVWTPDYNPSDGCVYWMGDEDNEERFNIYRGALNDPSKFLRLTDVPYVYEYGFNADMSKLAYVGRMGQNEQRRDELHVLDLKTLKDTIIGDDTPAYRYTWGRISFRPDGSGVVLTALKNMDRRYCTMMYVDLKSNKATPFNEPDNNGSFSGCDIMKNGWVNNDETYYFSDEDGYRNVYLFNVKTGKKRQITHYKTEVKEAVPVTFGKKTYLFAMLNNPIETTMMLIDPVSRKELYRHSSPYNYTIGAVKGNVVKAIANNNLTIFKTVTLVVGKKNVTEQTLIDMPDTVKNSLACSTVERLSIPTFDIDKNTGKPRMIHAYLYKPKNPLPKGKQMVMLESFYGGQNEYSTEIQMYTKAGIYVLSAAPRGSAGFGYEFEAMNDGDLGGNEIIDIINCAKYISKKLDIPADHVGCFGTSHGGYATMRLMTFPGEVNGVKASFPFGFGIETAGFCDILYQQNHTNIPDWTVLEAGDPVKNHDTIIERSPLYFASYITGPLMLAHGNADNRVDIEGSRLMDRMLTHLGKPHRYIEFEGMGHGIKGKEPQKKFFREAFRFLDEIEDGKSAEIKTELYNRLGGTCN
ncbi:MAG: prolyl oligopeptidase family serine peptidase [Prevotella sp.]|nr:prolyl oligopeptidase family serine peptidase [Prevotella sp.]